MKNAATILASPEPKAPTKQTKRAAADTPKAPNLKTDSVPKLSPASVAWQSITLDDLKDKTTARPAQIPKVQRLLNFTSLDQAASIPTPSTRASFAQSTPIQASALWNLPTSASSISSSSAQSTPIKAPSLWSPPTPASLIPSSSAQSTASKAPSLWTPPAKASRTAGLSVQSAQSKTTPTLPLKRIADGKAEQEEVKTIKKRRIGLLKRDYVERYQDEKETRTAVV
ncbi:MAG: hypothetical protein Q9210_000982 [Variospora velana]